MNPITLRCRRPPGCIENDLRNLVMHTNIQPHAGFTATIVRINSIDQSCSIQTPDPSVKRGCAHDQWDKGWWFTLDDNLEIWTNVMLQNMPFSPSQEYRKVRGQDVCYADR